MSVHLSIGGVPICGAVGRGISFTVAVGTCWESYHKWVTSLAEEGAPLCVLRKGVVWAVNGEPIDTPKSWFLELR